MSIFFDVQLWSSGPAREKQEELLARLPQAFWVQGPELRGFGGGIDQVIKSFDQVPQPALATHQFIKGRLTIYHAEIVTEELCIHYAIIEVISGITNRSGILYKTGV